MNDINFLPSRILEDQARRRRTLRQALLIGVTAACMAGWWHYSRGRLTHLEEYAGALEAESAALKAAQQQAARLSAERNQLQHQVQMQRRLTPPLNCTQLVAVLGRLLPPTATLTDLSVQDRSAILPRPEGAPRTGGPAAGKGAPPEAIHVAVTGLSPSDVDVANFVGALAEHPLFSNVKLVHSRPLEVGDLLAREYRLEMHVLLDRQFQPRRAGEVAHAH